MNETSSKLCSIHKLPWKVLDKHFRQNNLAYRIKTHQFDNKPETRWINLQETLAEKKASIANDSDASHAFSKHTAQQHLLRPLLDCSVISSSPVTTVPTAVVVLQHMQNNTLQHMQNNTFPQRIFQWHKGPGINGNASRCLSNELSLRQDNEAADSSAR